MIQALLDYYSQFMTISNSSPVIASVIALYGAGVVTYLMRNVPNKLWESLTRQLTTSLELTNAGFDGSDLQFKSFMEWYQKQPWARMSRSLSLNSKNYEGDCFVGAGVGNHYFLYKGRIFRIERSRLESSGSNMEKHQIIIKGLTRSHAIIEELVSEFRFKKEDDELYVKTFSAGNEWETHSVIAKRPLSTVILNAEDKAELIRQIDDFYASEQWYRERGIPYKLTIVLYGKPGTGKSSLIRALASHYENNLSIINLAGYSDERFSRAMAAVEKRSFVLIEDFDSSTAVKTRESKKLSMPSISGDDSVGSLSDIFDLKSLTLSGVLNTLDGVVSLNGVITFMTTNHIEAIDPALLRKGRVDLIMEIKYFQHAEVCQYIQLMFPDQVIPSDIEFSAIPGCDLQDLFKVHRNDFNVFLSRIPHKRVTDRVVPIRSRALEVREH